MIALTPIQVELLRAAADPKTPLSMSGVRFYRNGTPLDARTGWVAFDLYGAGLLVPAGPRSGKYQRVHPSDAAVEALAARGIHVSARAELC